MAGIFKNPTVSSKARYIPRVVKHEEGLQKQVCKYIRLKYPQVIFRSDFSSGQMLSQNQARLHASLQSGRSWPDLFIYKPMKVDGKQYAGLAIELKKEKTAIIVTRGSRKGELVANEHIREQYYMLQELQRLGYYADFGIGFDATIKIIDWYMGQPVMEVQTIF